MRTLFCPRCSTNIPALEEIPLPALAAVASISQTAGAMEAMTLLQRAGYTFREAKAAALHIPLRNDTCRRCNAELSGRGPVYCGKCRSLNLNRIGEER